MILGDAKKTSVTSTVSSEELADNPFIKQVEVVLDEQIRPFLEQHGGGVEILKFEDKKLYMRMFGGCQGCSSSQATLKGGIETILKGEFDQIEEVIDQTDHSAGENPFL